MKNKIKVYEHTAKLIKCTKCGVRMNETLEHKHNSKAMYKLGDDNYICASNKCTKSYLDESFDRFENEGHNGNEADRKYQELKEKYDF